MQTVKGSTCVGSYSIFMSLLIFFWWYMMRETGNGDDSFMFPCLGTSVGCFTIFTDSSSRSFGYFTSSSSAITLSWRWQICIVYWLLCQRFGALCLITDFGMFFNWVWKSCHIKQTWFWYIVRREKTYKFSKALSMAVFVSACVYVCAFV